MANGKVIPDPPEGYVLDSIPPPPPGYVLDRKKKKKDGPEVRTAAEQMGLPPIDIGEAITKDEMAPPERPWAEQSFMELIYPTLKKLNESRPGTAQYTIALEELKAKRQDYQRRMKAREVIRKTEEAGMRAKPPGVAKAVAGAGVGAIRGASLDYVNLVYESYKQLDKAVRDPKLPKEARELAATISELNPNLFMRLQEDPLFQVSEVAGEFAGYMVPLVGLNRALAFIKLAKYAPAASKGGLAYMKALEVATKDVAMGAITGGARHLDEGETRTSAILADAAIFGALSIFPARGLFRKIKNAKNMDQAFKIAIESMPKPKYKNRLANFRENYATKKNPVIIDGEKYVLGTDFWHGSESVERLKKMANEWLEIQNMRKSAAGYKKLKDQLRLEELTSLQLRKGQKFVLEGAPRKPKVVDRKIKPRPLGEARVSQIERMQAQKRPSEAEPVILPTAKEPRTKVVVQRAVRDKLIPQFEQMSGKADRLKSFAKSAPRSKVEDAINYYAVRSRMGDVNAGQSNDILKQAAGFKIGEPLKREKIKLVHHTKADGSFAKLDPKFFGSAFAGAEKKRAANYGKDFPKRTYAYVAGTQPETKFKNLPTSEVEVDAKSIYNLSMDPLNLMEKAGYDYTMTERLIKASGFRGYRRPHDPQMGNVVALFFEEDLLKKNLDKVKAAQFLSENKSEVISISEAQRRLSSDWQAAYNFTVKDINEEIGIDAVVRNALGDTRRWGTENSTLVLSTGQKDLDEVAYAVAQGIRAGRQKAGIAFVEDSAGKDALYFLNFNTKKSLNDVRFDLDRAKIEFRTIERDGSEYTISIVHDASRFKDPARASRLFERRLNKFGDQYGAAITKKDGTSRFIGGDTRTEGWQEAGKYIKEYEAKYPDRKHYRQDLVVGLRRIGSGEAHIKGEFWQKLDRANIAARQRIERNFQESLKRVGTGVPVDIAKNIPDYAIVGAAKILRGSRNLAQFTDAMVKDFGEAVIPHIKKIYSQAKQYLQKEFKEIKVKMPNTERLIEIRAKGEFGQEWYNKSRKELEKIFGDDTDLFIDIISITSMGRTPKANTTLGVRNYVQYKIGGEWVGVSKKQKPMLDRAVAGMSYGKNAPKITNFVKALKGDKDAVVVDRWLWRIYKDKDYGTAKEYKLIEAHVRDMAKTYGRDPREIQAAMWFGIKKERAPSTLKEAGRIEEYVRAKYEGDLFVKSGKEWIEELVRAARKDLVNETWGITYNPYKNVQDFLRKNKLKLSDEEMRKIKTFVGDLAKSKMLTSEQKYRKLADYLEKNYQTVERQAAVREVAESAKPRELPKVDPPTKSFLTNWIEGIPEKKTTKAIMRGAMGRRKRAEINAEVASEKRADWFDKQSEDFNIGFMERIEKNIPFEDPRLNDIAREYRKRLDKIWKIWDEIKGGNAAYVENYFPHIWEKPDKAARWAAGAYKKFYKNPWFTKQRYYQFIEDGLKAGLKLKTTNPELLLLEREISGLRHKETMDILNALKEWGYLKFLKPNQSPPLGWRKIQGDALKVFIPTEKGVVMAGEYYVPEKAANSINAYLSKGMWSIGKTPFGESAKKVARGLVRAKNNLVALKLGLSGFHFIETTMSSYATQMGRFVLALGRKDLRAAISRLAEYPITPIVWEKRGGDIYRAWMTGKFKNEYERHAVELIERAGGALTLERGWKEGVAGQWKGMVRDLRTGKYGRSISKVVPAIMEQIMKPLMDFYIPRLKAYGYIGMAEDFIKRNPGMGRAELDINLGKIWDSVDNRWGQLVYDNLFMNKLAKDIGVASQISMGWNIGTFREFGGGVIDLSKSTTGALVGKKPDVIVDRMLYSILYPIHFATLGGLMTYGFTGKPPSELLDYFYPRTGHTNPDGTAERFQMPTMMKEVFASREAVRKHGIEAPFVYATHKLAPLWTMMIELYTNKDFYGVDIRDPRAPIYEQLYQLNQHIFEQGFLPISISSAKRHRERTGDVSFMPYIGFSLAPGYVTKTPIQKEIYDLFSRRIPKGRTKQEWENYQKKSEIKRLLAWARKDKKYFLEAYNLFQKLKGEGVIPKSTKWSTYKKNYVLPGDIRAFKRLPTEDQEYLWKKMDKAEKAKYGQYRRNKKTSPLIILR